MKPREAACQNPFAHASAVNYLRRHKKSLLTFRSSLGDALGDQLVGILVVPELKKQPRRRPAKRARPSVRVLLSDLAGPKLTALISERNRTVSRIFKQTGLAEDRLATQHVSGLWRECSDGTVVPRKLHGLAQSAILGQSTLLPHFLIALHLSRKIEKEFEEYLLSFALSGSSVRGAQTALSDLDVFCVINDIDVKKLTVDALREKLREKVLSFGNELAGKFDVESRVNIQTYLLSDTWQWLQRGAPVLYTLLRDAVPLYDKGLIAVWKHMLSRGQITASGEAVTALISSADYYFERAGKSISNAAVEDLYYTVLNYSQAALAARGYSPQTPSETVGSFKEEFVSGKEGYPVSSFRVLERLMQLRKQIEHAERKCLDPVEVATLYRRTAKAKQSLAHLVERASAEKRRQQLTELSELLDSEEVRAAATIARACGCEEFEAYIRRGLSSSAVASVVLSRFRARLAGALGRAARGKAPSIEMISTLGKDFLRTQGLLRNFVDFLVACNLVLVTVEDKETFLVASGVKGVLVLGVVAREAGVGLARRRNGRLQTKLRGSSIDELVAGWPVLVGAPAGERTKQNDLHRLKRLFRKRSGGPV